MATYLSQPYQGSEFVSGVPIDLIAKVGMMKQLKYEQTIQTIQGQLDELGSADILKDSEKQYVNERLKQTVDKLNQFSGQNISESPFANQLEGYVSDVARDPRMYNAVADTKRIRNNMATLTDIKEKHPNYYSEQNEAIFMKDINDYLNGPPGTRYSGKEYSPYYNYDEYYRKVAKEVQDNPDIQREINWVIGADGKAVPRGDQEIKRVTAQKIQQTILNSNNQQAINQMRIDYNFSLANKTPEGAIQELKEERESQMARLKEAKDLVAKGIQDPNVLKSVQNVIEDLEGDGKDKAGSIKQLDGKINEVRLTGDPTKYYSFDKYIKDYTAGVSRSYAYEQKGKVEFNAIDLEDYKFAHEVQLEQVKSAAKLQEEKLKGIGGVDMSNFSDSFTNSFLNIENNPNREANIDDAGMYSLFDAYKNSDGTGTLTMGQGITYLDLTKVGEGIGVQNVNSNKLMGIAALNSEYAKWADKNTTREYRAGGAGSFATGNAGQAGQIVSVRKPLTEFLSTEQGKRLAQQIKDQSGLDVNNAQDRESIERFAASDDALQLVQFGNALSKLKGQVKVRPMNGMNIFAGNDRQYYGKMQGLFTRSQLENAMKDLGGSRAVDKLISKGIIEPTLNEVPASGKREAEPLYSLPITRKVEKDVESAYTNYMTGLNSGDNFYVKNLPAYQERFRNTFTSMVATRGLDTNTLKVKGQETLDNLAKSPLAAGTEGTQNLNWLKNEYLKATAILNSGASSSLSKLQAKKFLSDLIENSQNITNLQSNTNNPQASTTNEERKPGQTIGEFANNPGNLKYNPTDPIVKMFGGVDSGISGKDGGTFTKFPDQTTGFKAFQARLFGPTDGLYNSNYYQPNKTVDEALKSYSNYRIVNGKIQGYNGDIYPSVKNKKLKDLTQQERDELSARMLKIENSVVYQQLVDAGVINKV